MKLNLTLILSVSCHLQIIPCIDGVCHVQKIAIMADVDLELTRVCLQDLAMFGFVKLISIFQYCNTYATTSNLARLV